MKHNLIIKSSSSSVMVCKMDPRHSRACAKRQILGAATANLKGKGLEKKGLGASKRRQVLKKMPPTPTRTSKKRSLELEDSDVNTSIITSITSPTTLSSPTHTHTHPVPPRKKRRSADQDLLLAGDVLIAVKRTRRSTSMSTPLSSNSSPAPF